MAKTQRYVLLYTIKFNEDCACFGRSFRAGEVLGCLEDSVWAAKGKAKVLDLATGCFVEIGDLLPQVIVGDNVVSTTTGSPVVSVND